MSITITTEWPAPAFGGPNLGPHTVTVIPGPFPHACQHVGTTHFRDAPPEHTKPLSVARYGALGAVGASQRPVTSAAGRTLRSAWGPHDRDSRYSI